MLHFAYGANMHRDVMRRHAPTAQPIGAAALADHRFIITADGYASVAPALVYVARPLRTGQPKAGYMELVVAAARAWHLPRDYISSLRHWLPRRPTGAGTRKFGDIAWM